MNVIQEYTLSHIRKNRRSSVSISIAILISASLLYSLCILAQTAWSWQVEKLVAQGGNWHGELNDETRGSQLAQIEGNPHVGRTLIKGRWEAVRLPEDTKLPYLLMRDADRNYWENMPEKNILLEGRVPQEPGEIAVSKSFFDRNPGFRIGDTLTLPVGDRTQGGEIMDVQSIRGEGEAFSAKGERTLTLVGKMDVTTSTVNPGYYALGFLDRSAIAPEDGLAVYLQMKDMRKTYTALPQVAASLGWEKDEFGDYALRYNIRLLLCYGILPPDQAFSMEAAAMPTMFALLAAVAVGAFVLIIHSAFALSANARVKQLGMFRSVGATPRQIRSSILFEGLVLSAAPIAAGLGLGYLFSSFAAKLLTARMGDLIEGSVRVTFSWWVVLGGAALSLLTVLLSASIPARRMAKLTPIEAVRQVGGDMGLGKPKRHRLLPRVFGFSGELAANSFSARKRGLRTCISALVMCLVLVGGLICVLRVSELVRAENEKAAHYDMNVILSWDGEADGALLSQMQSLPQVRESAAVSSTTCSLWVDAQDEAPEFTAAGGLAGVDQDKYRVIERNGKYRVQASLIGMDDRAFADYCATLGQDPADYHGGGIPKAIAVSTVPQYINTRDRKLKDVEMPFLRLAPGGKLLLDEGWSDEIKSDYTFEVETTFFTGQRPVIDRVYGYYSVQLFMPMQTYYSIAENFLPEHAAINYRVDVGMLVGDEDSPQVQQELEGLCEEAMAEEDYLVYSKLSDRADNAAAGGAVQAVFNSVAALLGLIGVFNSFTSVASGMRLRRCEFAMLRSVGMDSPGIGRILLLEGAYFAAMPVLFSIPFLLAICAAFLWMMGLSWAQFLPVAPWGQLLLCSIAIMATVGGAYWLSARKLRQDTVIDAIKEEML